MNDNSKSDSLTPHPGNHLKSENITKEILEHEEKRENKIDHE